MRIAVTGREGQVAQSLLERARVRPGFEVLAVGRPALDLARPDTVAPALAAARPDLVVSAAAYTAVDQAEEEPELAYRINEDGAGAVAAAAALLGVPMIHLSTDYVFDGLKDGPYTEADAPNPQSVYGASKLAGEKAVAAACPQAIVLRTAWIYSPFGRNFVKTMLKLAGERHILSVVDDQWGNPTSALDIADGILHVAERLAAYGPRPGIYHLAGTGATSWAGFAREALEASRRHCGPNAEVKEITTAEYPTKARRPANSRLLTEKLAKEFGWTAPDWRESLERVAARVVGVI